MRDADRRRAREEDKRRVRESIKESRTQLDEIIEAWNDVRNLELFFERVEATTLTLSEEERERVLSRLALARTFVGTQNPMEFFLDWKAPLERYRPRYDREGSEIRSADDEDE